jgi:hypothetical protein
MPRPWNDGIMECWNDREKNLGGFVRIDFCSETLFHYSIFPMLQLGEAQLLNHSIASVNTEELAGDIIAFVRGKEDKSG